jgi:hypothetical protein
MLFIQDFSAPGSACGLNPDATGRAARPVEILSDAG